MKSSFEKYRGSGVADEARIWAAGVWILWFLECLLLYFHISFFGGAWSIGGVGWGIIEVDLKRLTPIDVLAAFVVYSVCGFIFCVFSMAVLRLARRVFKKEISSVTFHGAVYIAIIIFYYGAVIINTVFLPKSFELRDQALTLVWGLLCVLYGASVYRRFRRDQNAGMEYFSFGALCSTIFICLFGIWPWLQYHTRFKWLDAWGVPARLGILAVALVVERIFIEYNRKKPGKITPKQKRKFKTFQAAVPLALVAIAAIYQAIPEKGLPQSSVKITGKNLPNILLVVMDTVRADALSCYSPSTGHTPFVDSVAAKGAMFEQNRTPTCWTLPGHASMFTALYPSTHKADWEFTYLDGKLATMAEILKTAGYLTGAFSSNIWVSPYTNMTQGFDYFYIIGLKDEIDRKIKERPLLLWEVAEKPMSARFQRWGLTKAPSNRKLPRAAMINANASKWVADNKNKDAPKFVFVNYIESHHPYNAPGIFFPKPAKNMDVKKIARVNKDPLLFLTGKETFKPEELEYFKTLYYASVSYEDEVIKHLFADLGKSGFFDNAIIIITADHGEYLGEHDQICHLFGVHEPVIRAPLIIAASDKIAPGTRYKQLVQTVDLLPTLLDLTGVKYDGESVFQGKSLLKAIKENKPVRHYSISELMYPGPPLEMLKKDDPNLGKQWETRQRTITDGEYQLEVHEDGFVKLWKLGTNGAPDQDVTANEPERVKTMKAVLNAWLESLPKTSGGAGKAPAMTPEFRAKLKALGYVD